MAKTQEADRIETEKVVDKNVHGARRKLVPAPIEFPQTHEFRISTQGSEYRAPMRRWDL
jgi:hypothetical protein